eukprot:TRINITY_DN3437_c0_g2_i1.p1 TRINITY_DN3437_c0_g2~~TRINITY_DN3437_c0_g2_i1.p1  ORF type:complete len:273 (-),score=-45.27 TRINITY_DN3437_c0_g2_i1:37-855(-)
MEAAIKRKQTAAPEVLTLNLSSASKEHRSMRGACGEHERSLHGDVRAHGSRWEVEGSCLIPRTAGASVPTLLISNAPLVVNASLLPPLVHFRCGPLPSCTSLCTLTPLPLTRPRPSAHDFLPVVLNAMRSAFRIPENGEAPPHHPITGSPHCRTSAPRSNPARPSAATRSPPPPTRAARTQSAAAAASTNPAPPSPPSPRADWPSAPTHHPRAACKPSARAPAAGGMGCPLRGGGFRPPPGRRCWCGCNRGLPEARLCPAVASPGACSWWRR